MYLPPQCCTAARLAIGCSSAVVCDCGATHPECSKLRASCCRAVKNPEKVAVIVCDARVRAPH